MGKVYIFYHIYCNHDTATIVRDQITKVLYSGLYKRVDSVFCFLAGSQKYVDPIAASIQRYGSKFVIAATGYNDTTFERFTLEKIHKYIQHGDKFLYLHTKGLSQLTNQTIIDWRDFLEYYLIAKYERCISDLDKADLVGVNFKVMPQPHYSGNIWWCNADYFLTLPPKIGLEYLDPEMYIAKAFPRIINYLSTELNHYREPYPPTIYTDN